MFYKQMYTYFIKEIKGLGRFKHGPSKAEKV